MTNKGDQESGGVSDEEVDRRRTRLLLRSPCKIGPRLLDRWGRPEVRVERVPQVKTGGVAGRDGLKGGVERLARLSSEAHRFTGWPRLHAWLERAGSPLLK